MAVWSKKGNCYRITFTSLDKVLIDFVQALIAKLSCFNPAISKGREGVRTVRISDKKLGEKLFALSPEYRTFPINKNLQPTIKFLYGKNLKTKCWALRFAFTTDGCISLSNRGKPELNLACYNSNLSEEWLNFLGLFGINSHIAKCRKSGQGVSGVRIYDSKSIYAFYKLGGFIEGVKISKKSARYLGMQKNRLLEKVVTKLMDEGGFEPPTSRLSVVCTKPDCATRPLIK